MWHNPSTARVLGCHCVVQDLAPTDPTSISFFCCWAHPHNSRSVNCPFGFRVTLCQVELQHIHNAHGRINCSGHQRKAWIVGLSHTTVLVSRHPNGLNLFDCKLASALWIIVSTRTDDSDRTPFMSGRSTCARFMGTKLRVEFGKFLSSAPRPPDCNWDRKSWFSCHNSFAKTTGAVCCGSSTRMLSASCKKAAKCAFPLLKTLFFGMKMRLCLRQNLLRVLNFCVTRIDPLLRTQDLRG